MGNIFADIKAKRQNVKESTTSGTNIISTIKAKRVAETQKRTNLLNSAAVQRTNKLAETQQSVQQQYSPFYSSEQYLKNLYPNQNIPVVQNFPDKIKTVANTPQNNINMPSSVIDNIPAPFSATGNLMKEKTAISTPQFSKQTENYMTRPAGEFLKSEPPKTVWENLSSHVKDYFSDPKAEQARNWAVYTVAKNLNIPDVNINDKQTYVNSHLNEVTKEMGIRQIPTTKENIENLFTLGIVAGGFQAPLLIAKGLAEFEALKLGTGYIYSKIKGEKFDASKPLSLSSLLPDYSSETTRDAVDLLEFAGQALLLHGVNKVAPKIRTALTKNITTEFNAPKTFEIEASKVKDIFQTGEKISQQEKDLVGSLGLKASEYKQAIKEGISITVPAENVTKMVDKPYWGKIKEVLKQAPENTIIKRENIGDTSFKIGKNTPIEKPSLKFGGYIAPEQTPFGQTEQLLSGGQTPQIEPTQPQIPANVEPTEIPQTMTEPSPVALPVEKTLETPKVAEKNIELSSKSTSEKIDYWDNIANNIEENSSFDSLKTNKEYNDAVNNRAIEMSNATKEIENIFENKYGKDSLEILNTLGIISKGKVGGVLSFQNLQDISVNPETKLEKIYNYIADKQDKPTVNINLSDNPDNPFSGIEEIKNIDKKILKASMSIYNDLYKIKNGENIVNKKVEQLNELQSEYNIGDKVTIETTKGNKQGIIKSLSEDGTNSTVKIGNESYSVETKDFIISQREKVAETIKESPKTISKKEIKTEKEPTKKVTKEVKKKVEETTTEKVAPKDFSETRYKISPEDKALQERAKLLEQRVNQATQSGGLAIKETIELAQIRKQLRVKELINDENLASNDYSKSLSKFIKKILPTETAEGATKIEKDFIVSDRVRNILK
ncbi:MAG: hypothetical protein WCX46_04735, partial [Candidatus Paceibacterota bacterium]